MATRFNVRRNRIRPAREARLKGQIRMRRSIIKTDCGMKSRRSTSSAEWCVAAQVTRSQMVRGTVKVAAKR